MPVGLVLELRHPAELAEARDRAQQPRLVGAGPGHPQREGRLPDKLTHPWFYDARERAQQHKHDEAAYLEGSPWRYNDITAATNEE